MGRYFKNYNDYPITYCFRTGSSSTLPTNEIPTIYSIDANSSVYITSDNDYALTFILSKDDYSITSTEYYNYGELYSTINTSDYVEPTVSDTAHYFVDGSVYRSTYKNYLLLSNSSDTYSTYGFNTTAENYVGIKFGNITYTKTETTVTITNSTTNCTVTYQNSSGETVTSFNVGDTAIVVLTCDSSYVWSDIIETYQPSITSTSGGVATSTTYSSDYTTATITITSIPSDITITGTPTTEQTISLGDGTLTNCTSTHTPEGSSTTANIEVAYTLTANDGYYFKEVPVLRVYSSGTGYTDYDFTISEDTLTATVTYTTTSTDSDIYPVAVATLKEDVPTAGYSFVNIYHCTEENITDLAKYRFSVASGSSPVNIVDLGYYVTSLKRFYCDIPDSIASNIALATIDTQISANLVASNTVELDCGTITIDSTNNNSNDYSNTTCYLLLPFIGIANIDSDLVMNRTIQLKYNVSTISGVCVASIYETENSTLLATFTGQIAENIPYILNNIEWQMLGDIDVNSNMLYGFTPLLTIMYRDNYNANETALVNDSQYALLSTLTGLNYINDIVIDNTSIDANERDLILAELQNGVIF